MWLYDVSENVVAKRQENKHSNIVSISSLSKGMEKDELIKKPFRNINLILEL